MKEEDLPDPAVRPYPSQHVVPWTMKNGVEITIRPIRPEDEPELTGSAEAEVAVLVRDDFQHQGLGTELVRRLMLTAKEEKPQYVHSMILGVNREMRAICNRLGFVLHVDLEDDLVNARVKLS
jgi:GNAT superfamily N-acetyltransferase